MAARAEALAVLLLPVLVAGTSGAPSTAGLRAAEPLTPLVTVIALLAWATAGWLLLLLLLATAGRAGCRPAHCLLPLLAPPSLRGLAQVAVGTAVVLSATTATPTAWAATTPPPPVDLEWGSRPLATPLPAAAAAGPLTPRPVPAQVARPRSPAEALGPTRPAEPAVTVRPGDSLWLIAARSLGPAAGAAQVATAWPRWWQANRAQIGGNPHLIHPGVVLVRPHQPPPHRPPPHRPAPHKGEP